MIDATLICEICLQDFGANINRGPKWCHGQLAAHRRKCRLPYTEKAYEMGAMTVYCLPPNAPIRQATFAFKSVVLTMHHSGEVPADNIGWNPKMSRTAKARLQPHVFISACDGKTAGVVVVETRQCRTADFTRGRLHGLSDHDVERWTIGRVWVYKPYRRQGIGSLSMRGIGHYFGIDVSELGWMLPLSDDGEQFRNAIFDGPMHVTTGK